MRDAPVFPPLEHPALIRLWLVLLGSPLGNLVLQPFWQALGFPQWRRAPVDEPPTFLPPVPRYPRPLPWDREQPAQQAWQAPGPSQVAWLRQGYEEGRWMPEDVAQAFLKAHRQAETTSPPLRGFIKVNEERLQAQARAARERLEAGTLLGLLDGIPFGVKDEIHASPYTTSLGWRLLQTLPESSATVVQAWESAGGLLAGKTNMHEFGMGATGFNPSFGTALNPRAPRHAPGGSSSGSAAVVAAGLVPLALATDAGGSIRIPAAFCGVYGLKPTFGRVSLHGVGPITWSLAHVGPIAATVKDLALGLAYLVGSDAQDPTTWHQPPLDLAGWTDADLTGLVLGVDDAWNQAADPALLHALEEALVLWSRRGARVRRVRLEELEPALLAHLVTLGVEAYQAVYTWLMRHGGEPKRLAPDVRSLLHLVRRFSPEDYLRAQRWRTRAVAQVEQVLQEVHVLVTPATGILPPRLSPRAQRSGRIDTTQLLRIIRFTFLTNLTGHPALVLPWGPTSQNLPRGLQLIGRYWEEPLLLRLAWIRERHGPPLPEPARYHPLSRALKGM